MIYLFSSASKDLYRQDVLDACCVPAGHVMRFRYSERLVPREIREQSKSLKDEAAIVVFASHDTDTAKDEKVRKTGYTPDFDFIPIREAKVIQASLQAGILIIDIAVGKFLNYGASGNNDLFNKWDREIKGHQQRPLAPGSGSEGFFIYRANTISYQASDDLTAWRSLIERINGSQLANCVTYRVLGFYRVGRWREKLIKPKVRRTDCTYEFPMGGSVLMRLFFFHVTDPSEHSPVLGLSVDQKAFTSASRDEFRITSRYDEARVLLSCARTPDPVYSALSILQKAGSFSEKVWAAQPRFITLIKAPFGFLFGTLLLFALGLLALSTSTTDTVAWLSTWLSSSAANIFAAMPRALGTLLVFIASWRYLRKFPLK